ncbi:MAG: hypothetical protein J5661_06055 [Bacteroidaceae bacterium]|nr:hypothetical protein [Bacteroidaceae bacterium]
MHFFRIRRECLSTFRQLFHALFLWRSALKSYKFLQEEFHYCGPHYTFVEALPLPSRKRSPRVFEGRYITVTHRSDGTFHPNFRPMKVDEGFSVDGYALGVCNELRQALKGLVEEKFVING